VIRVRRTLRALSAHPLAWAVGGGLLVGALLELPGLHLWAGACWAITTLVALVPLVQATVRALSRGRIGVDLVALLAMAGALVLGEYLAGAVIALMLTGGQALETFAAGRARRELTALLERAPRSACRESAAGWEEVPAELIAVGELLLVKSGEVVPVDGELREAAALDESSFTGEAPLVERARGELVRGGVLNGGSAFHLRATSTAATSAYAGIVRLVEQAQEQRARFARLADRWAGLFVPLTLAIAGVGWAAGDSRRALAVLVVATPCPLILAAPVAFVGGLSRSAKRGVLVKGGQALEALAQAKTLILDKTGTVTAGRPVLASTLGRTAMHSPAEVLRLAAALDQLSPHVYAEPIVRAARGAGLELPRPAATSEIPGQGIRGTVEGREVALGKLEYVGSRADPWALDTLAEARTRGHAVVFVSLDGGLAGALLLEDPLRPDARSTISAMRGLGVQRVILLTGDHRSVAEAVGAQLEVDQVLAGCSPAEKVDVVRREVSAGARVLMVGDGLNDAPALAAADVGVALGVRGSAASVESADVVLTVDRLDRLVEARSIAMRTATIARQSVAVGMLLSLVGMGFAAMGYLPPTAGALLQEGIDVAVILNALRTLR
jgi:heavy metal translocating P-type ATPase